MMLSEEARKFFEMNKIMNYKINSDGTVDVNGSVSIYTQQVKFPVTFGKIAGYFDCGLCGLTSLEGAPKVVDGYFSCSNNLLTSLVGAPSYINGFFSCRYNELTSLHNINKNVKEINRQFDCYYSPIKDSVLGLLLIKGLKEIILGNKEVTTILNKYIGQGRAGVIGAQQELFDAGLDEYARL